MNLRELRDYVLAHSDYRPSNTEYRDFVNGAIQEAYFRLYMERPWTFRHVQNEAFLQSALNSAEATSDLDRRGYPYTAPVGLIYKAGSRLATATAPILRLGGYKEVPMNRWDWIGQDLVDGLGQVHKILWVDQGVDDQSGPLTRIYVDTPFRRAALAGENPDQEWEIVPRRTFFPPTVAQVSSAVLTDTPYRETAGGPRDWRLEIVTHDFFRDRSRWGSFDSQSAGFPNWLVLENYEQIPPAGQWTAAVVEDEESNLPTGYYEFAWCFLGPGRAHGPLSEPVTVQVTQSSQAIDLVFTGPDDAPWQSYAIQAESYAGGPRYTDPGVESAYPKGLFINTNVDPTTGERRGPPRWMSVPAGAFISATDFASGDYALAYGNLPWDALNGGRLLNVTWLRSAAQTVLYRDCGGMVQAGAVYPYLSAGVGANLDPVPVTDFIPIPPPPTEDATVLEQKQLAITLSYWIKPEPLVMDTSVPAMPPEFHQVIADRALADICMFGNDETKAQLYERRYADGVARLTKRYVVEHGATYVRQDAFAPSRWDGIWTATVQSYLGRR